MTINLKKFLRSFVMSRTTAVISVAASVCLALYLSALDEKISAIGHGAFYLQTTLSTDAFYTAFSFMNAAKKEMLNNYLYIDIIFAFFSAVSFTSVSFFMTNQLAALEMPGRQKTERYANLIKNTVIIISPLSAILATIGNLFIIYITAKNTISSSHIIYCFIISASRYLMVSILIISIAALLIIKRILLRSSKK